MTRALVQSLPQPRRATLLLAAWVVTLLISLLPDVLWREFQIGDAAQLFWAKIALLGLGVILTFFWRDVRSLRLYFIVFLVLYLAERVSSWIGGTPFWKSYFPTGASFTNELLGFQLLRFGVALVMVIAMLVLKRRRNEFFLVRGDTDAPVAPVRWLGIDETARWKRFGWILAMVLPLGTLAFILLAGRPSMEAVTGAAPLLPAVLLFAAMNAFSEEMSYRAPQLATTHEVIGKDQSILLAAAFFGIGHFYGVPYGLVGVVMSGFLGWLLGKSMLETKGFFWPWFIHFTQDVVIFTFLGIGSITAGGV
jgi:hypothetical protein